MVPALDFSPDGKTLAGAAVSPSTLDSTGGVVRLWDVRTGKRLRTLTVKGSSKGGDGDDGLRMVIFSPDGGTIATGSGRSVVARLVSPDGHRGPPVSRGAGLIRFWDAKTGLLRETVKAHDYAVNGLAYAMEGRMIISSSFDKSLRQWAVQLPH